jgi:hypothetical protein
MKKTLIFLVLSAVISFFNAAAIAQQITTDTTQKAPVASVAGVTTGEIGKDALLKADSLICSEKNSIIVSYTLTVNTNRDLIEKKGTNSLLTGEMKKIIDKLLPGNKIYFEDIKARFPDGSIRVLSPISLEIK